ncbi:MAG: preprotein translocase subunit SecE, partial [Spirochaetes bacterium]|nr:preprotein translocase subunit SecE [Spirochaetota bacterium]
MKKLLNFIKDAKAELKKVEWPQKDDVVNSTIVVL